MHYYNEIEPYAAQWTRNLIAAGVLPEGHVDTRDIRDVLPSDLAGYTSCHFFAGLGGWAYALRLAGWPDDRPVWTGSCPCQPFSTAGKGAGFADERHLWPAWHWLIVQCRPDVVFGEQVDKALDWLDLVSTDLEGEDYACGPIILPAAGVGAPHGRHRLWFVADASSERLHGERLRVLVREPRSTDVEAGRGCEIGVLGDPRNPGLQERECDGSLQRQTFWPFERQAVERGSYANFWSACEYLRCRDGKLRPVEPGTFPLAHGIPNRVGRLRAYGNAIVPEVAAEVIRAYLGATA